MNLGRANRTTEQSIDRILNNIHWRKNRKEMVTEWLRSTYAKKQYFLWFKKKERDIGHTTYVDYIKINKLLHYVLIEKKNLKYNRNLQTESLKEFVVESFFLQEFAKRCRKSRRRKQ